MSERIRRMVLGAISGVVAAVAMELLGGYLSGGHVVARAVVAGGIGYLVFASLDAMSAKRPASESDKK